MNLTRMSPMRFYLVALVVAVLGMIPFGSAMGAEPVKATPPADLAAIGSEDKGLHKERLITPEPPVLPDTVLPWAPKSQPFTPLDKLDTPQELEAELARFRTRYEPFTVDLAPAIPNTRIAIPLTSFDWRRATPEDGKDFLIPMSGKGDWKKVTVPHYDGPVGLATTYYRTSFTVTQAMLDLGAIFVDFKGVDYRAKAFVNGTFVGSHEGFFAPFAFDCTAQARLGDNVLLVQVENDFVMHNFSSNRGDKIYAFTGPGFDNPDQGWVCCPPGMGIYQPVTIEARPRLQVHDLFVRPQLEKSGAEAWIELRNCDINEPNVILELAVHGQNFQQTVFSGALTDGVQKLALDGTTPKFDKETSPKVSKGLNYFRIPFTIPDFRSWSPAEPWLYQIQVTLRDTKGTVLDVRKRQFGMRSFTMDTTNTPKGRLFLNGQPIRLRGANTMGFEQQSVIRGDIQRLRDDILLAKLSNMNFLRITQRPVQDEVYEWCDRLGLMTQTDLPLSWVLRRSQFAEAVRQAEEMERLVRAHPCNIMVTYINEPQRNGWGHPHRNLSRKELESFFTAADQVVLLANPDRVIKAIDGDSEPPGPGLPDHHLYGGWYNGGGHLGRTLQGYWSHVKPGWLYACGEFGVEGLDSVETMRRRYPAKWLPSSLESEHTWKSSKIPLSQTEKMHRMWFDTQTTLAGWSEASQAHQAQIIRLQTEAYRRDRRLVSFAVHLFIDAWPAGWLKTIMDVDRNPKPAFYVYRDALTPVAANLYSPRKALFSGEQAKIAAWICNDRPQEVNGAKVRYQIECQGKTLRTGIAPATVAADDSNFQGWISCEAPTVSERTTLTVRLALEDAAGTLVHDTALTLDVFPALPALAKADVLVVGSKNGKAAKLARELGLNPIFSGVPAGLVLCDDPKALAASVFDLTTAVRAGARVVCVEWPTGTHVLAGDTVTIEACTDGPRLFVSRATGHSLVAGFAPEDFKFWYHAGEQGIRPHLASLFVTPGSWTPVLLSGQWEKPALAAAEKVDGQGRWILCQVQLQGRLDGNPVARLFAQRLITPTAP